MQLIDAKRWKTTLPVGFATAAGVPAVRATNTRSCTTVPATAVVITAPELLRMSVRAVASAHNFEASALSPNFPSPVDRNNDTPPTTTVVEAFTDVVPVVEELITTVHEPVTPTVVQLLGPTNAAEAPPEFVNANEITVPAGALT